MIIDFHTHTFPEALAPKVMDKLSETANIKYYSDATNSGLTASMSRAGIDMSVILPVVTKPSQYVTINDTARRINEEYAEGIEEVLSGRKPKAPVLLSFGGIHPDNENYREILKGLKASGIRGIKIHPVYQGVNIDDIRFLRIIDCACELGLTIVMHAGHDLSFEGECCAPDQTRRMIDAIHPRKMVLAHMGGAGHWDEVEQYICGQDVYIDTSFSVIPMRLKHSDEVLPMLEREQFCRIIASHGADRFVFATDNPWGDQSETLEIIGNYIEDAEVREKILWKNAMKLLK